MKISLLAALITSSLSFGSYAQNVETKSSASLKKMKPLN
jgi:hypothetical protein